VNRKVRLLLSADGRLLLKTAILLALTRVALSVCSFQTLLTLVSRLSVPPPNADGAMTIDRVPWAVNKASHWVPGARHCLTQALAAKLLFARRGLLTQLRIGVAKDQAGRLKAHAWLQCDGAAILGVPDSGLDEYRLLPHLDRI
jgi:hypothetical protein